jgi:hypothetical protein
MTKNNTPDPEKMELEDLTDLINLITTTSANDFSLYHYKVNEDNIYFVYVIIHDFYDYRGVPVLVHTRTKIEPKLYLKYQPNKNPKYVMTDKLDTEINTCLIKIIKVKVMPKCLEINE